MALALWWGFVNSVRYARIQKLNKDYKFKGSTYMPFFFCSSKGAQSFPIESFIKLLGLSIHFYMEVKHDRDQVYSIQKTKKKNSFHK
jgi:hypothetical protein